MMSCLFSMCQRLPHKLYTLLITVNARSQLCTRIYGSSKPVKYFHTSGSCGGKLFFDKENAHSHRIFYRPWRYSVTTTNMFVWIDEVSPEKHIFGLCESPPKTAEGLLKGLEIIVAYCLKTGVSVTDQRFDKFVDIFMITCDLFSDVQVRRCLNCLKFLPNIPRIKGRNFYDMWKPLDDLCLSRLKTYSTDQILTTSEFWYQLNLSKYSDFVSEGVKKLGNKIRRLSLPQFIEYTFTCNLLRKPVQQLVEIELYFNRVCERLNIQEVGIVCAFFFKTKSKLRCERLIYKVYKCVIDNLDNADNISLVNCIKALRYSSKLSQADAVYGFLENICPYVNKLSLVACLHVALIGCDLQIFHSHCIELVLHRFYKDIDNARLKDLERISHVMGLFNVEFESRIEQKLCEKILSSLPNRIDEIIRHPKCFQACLHYQTLCNHYNQDLLSASLDEKFIQHICRKYTLGREALCLDSFVRINLKGTYNGNYLSETQRISLSKTFCRNIPGKNGRLKLAVTDRILVEVNDECRKMWDGSIMKHVLPHFERPDIIIPDVTTKHDQIYCSESYTNLDVPSISIDLDKKSFTRIAIVIGSWNNFIRKSSRPTGLLAMKLHQLDLLGYRSILVPWYEWNELEATADKLTYLLKRVRQLENSI